mgnify:CR=1 FL=1
MLRFLLLIVSPFSDLFFCVSHADNRCRQGTYTLSAWEMLDLSCKDWTCTNNLWPQGTVYSNTSTVCEPGTVSFGGANARVQKVE